MTTLDPDSKNRNEKYTIHLLQNQRDYKARELDKETFEGMWELLHKMDKKYENRNSKYIVGRPGERFTSNVLDKKSPEKRLRVLSKEYLHTRQKSDYTPCYIPKSSSGDKDCFLLLEKESAAVIIDSKDKLKMNDIFLHSTLIKRYLFIPSINEEASYTSSTDKNIKQTQGDLIENSENISNHTVLGEKKKIKLEIDKEVTAIEEKALDQRIDGKKKEKNNAVEFIDREFDPKKEEEASTEIRGRNLTPTQGKKIFQEEPTCQIHLQILNFLWFMRHRMKRVV